MKIVRSVKYILFVLYISIFTWIPYLAAYIYAWKHNLVYGGIYGYGVDTPAYLAWMTPGASVGLKHINLFTSQPHPSVFLNTFYVVFGQLFNFTHIPLPFGLLLLRIIFGTLIMVVFYKTISSITKSKQIATYSLYFFMFGGGLVQLAFRNIHISIASHFETLPGIRIFAFPHSVLAVTLIWLIVYLLTKLDFLNTKNTLKISFLIGILSLTTTLLVPFYLLIIATILLLFYIREIIVQKKIWPSLVSAVIISILSCSYIFYLYLVVLKDPIWQTKFNQASQIPPATILALVISFCLYLLFIFFDCKIKKIWPDRFKYLMWAWVISAATLSMLGLPGGWRYIEGITLPLSILATWGLLNLFKLKNYYFKFIIIFSGALFVLLIIVEVVSVHLTNIYQKKFITKDLALSLDWIKINSKSDTVIVSNTNAIIYGPYYARRRVFVGHLIETYQAEKKYRAVQESFINGELNSDIIQLLQKTRVCFIIDNSRTKTIPAKLLKSNVYNSVDFNSLQLICEQEAIKKNIYLTK